MRILHQTGYSLLTSDKRLIVKPLTLTIEQLADFAEKYFGGKLYLHVFSEEEIHLYDKPLSDKAKEKLFMIVGIPKKSGCCGGG